MPEQRTYIINTARISRIPVQYQRQKVMNFCFFTWLFSIMAQAFSIPWGISFKFIAHIRLLPPTSRYNLVLYIKYPLIERKLVVPLSLPRCLLLWNPLPQLFQEVLCLWQYKEVFCLLLNTYLPCRPQHYQA